MNRDQVRGLWGQLKGKAKVIWGELTNDDTRKSEGAFDKLYGRLQRKFGDKKEDLKRGLDKIELP